MSSQFVLGNIVCKKSFKKCKICLKGSTDKDFQSLYHTTATHKCLLCEAEAHSTDNCPYSPIVKLSQPLLLLCFDMKNDFEEIFGLSSIGVISIYTDGVWYWYKKRDDVVNLISKNLLLEWKGKYIEDTLNSLQVRATILISTPILLNGLVCKDLLPIIYGYLGLPLTS